MILIDNYDSFTYNIVQYLRELGANPLVFKNDEITIDEIKKLEFESIIISPGPSNPNNSGISMDVIKEFYKTKKILGVCLGHQCMAQFFGAQIVKSTTPMHGKVSKVFYNDGDALFNQVEQGFMATRYHSLVVDKQSVHLPLIITAKTKENDIMALKHDKYDVYGVQFHPEAILTQYGKTILNNFLKI